MEFKEELYKQNKETSVNRFQNENNDFQGELDNISLDDSLNPSKKKYLILGIALLTTFLITMIIINFMSDSGDDSDDFVNKDTITQTNTDDKILPTQDEEDKALGENQEEINIDYTVDDDVEDDAETEENKEPEPEPEPIKPKQIPATTNAIPGSFIQLGAFLNYPKQEYLIGISSKGFKPKIYKVQIKGKIYYKVLIGPYKSRKESRANLSEIRKVLNTPNAFLYQ
jgi:DedD protein